MHSEFHLFAARPWLVDNLDDWIQRLRGKSHKCAAIFVDNSGMDVVLGVIPFALELLKRQTKVTSIFIVLQYVVLNLAILTSKCFKCVPFPKISNLESEEKKKKNALKFFSVRILAK